MKNLARRRQPPMLQLLNFLAKFPTERIYPMNNLYEAETSLNGIIKYIYSQTNNKSPGNDGLKEYFINFLLMNLLLSFQIFMAPGESLVP